MGSVFIWSFLTGFLTYLAERADYEVASATEELELHAAAAGDDLWEEDE